MSNPNVLLILLIALFSTGRVHAISNSSIENCYAQLENDTLRIGNSCIERTFLWNGGNLMTVSLLDKKHNNILHTDAQHADFAVEKGNRPGTASSLNVQIIHESSVHITYLRVLVEYNLDDLSIRREFRVYPDVPAIACRNYLIGKLPDKMENILDQLSFPGKHFYVKCINFHDATDFCNNLVTSQSIIPYKHDELRGNLLFARREVNGNGFFMLKEAPCSDKQLAYPGYDYISEFGHTLLIGMGIEDSDITPDDWTETYGSVIGVFGPGELSALLSLRAYEKTIRKHDDRRDEMIMMNTWGDRSRDAKLDEPFCLAELEYGSRLGITHFQIDDGWQTGKSPASALRKGSFDNIWLTNDYWKPDREKYPDGLAPIVNHARSLGIELGLWFNPSNQDNLTDWEKDADAIIDLYQTYDIRYFKIDGLKVISKTADVNLRKLLEKVQRKTQEAVTINMDVTAGIRPGYFYMGIYGNIFLENRYTDFGTYFPFHTLRNLWQLSAYVPPERLQIEFLNKWRNKDKYNEDDRFAPSNYDFSYLFALTMAAQPLAWLEATNLPEDAFTQVRDLILNYRKIMAEFHRGVILPIGNEPDGVAWTGFQSIGTDSPTNPSDYGFFLIYREDNTENQTLISTWIPEGARVQCTPVLGEGKPFTTKTGLKGSLAFSLPRPNSFALYRYEIKSPPNIR